MNENNAQFQTLRTADAPVRGPLKVIRDYKQGGKLLTFENGSKSEDSLQPGYTVQGVYEGVDIKITAKGKESKEYKIRGDGDTLFMLKACSSLNDEETGLAAVAEGTLVRVIFQKMKITKSGNDFAVFTVQTAKDSE